MFGTESHALNRARKRLDKGEANVAFMMEIDPSEIKNAYGRHVPILQVSDVIDQYPGLLPDGIEKHWVGDEYLALYRMPSWTLVGLINLWDDIPCSLSAWIFISLFHWRERLGVRDKAGIWGIIILFCNFFGLFLYLNASHGLDHLDRSSKFMCSFSHLFTTHFYIKYLGITLWQQGIYPLRPEQSKE